VGEALPPPRYVNAPVEFVYELELPVSVVMTGLRIYGLGWNHSYEYTDPISLMRLCELCRLGRSQMYGHLQQLVVKGVLRYTSAADVFVFDLLPARRTSTARGRDRDVDKSSPEIRTGQTLSCCCCSDTESEHKFTLEQQQQQSSPKGGGGGGGGGQSGNSDWAERVEVLARMGVLEPTRSELAGLEWATVEYLDAWERWWLEQVEDKRPGLGVVITQVRIGVEPPASKGELARRQTEAQRQKYKEWGWQK
jgi:hypothetical protein